MTQYQLSVYHPEDAPPADFDIEQVYADVNVLNDELKAAERLGLRRRPAAVEHGHGGPGQGRRGAHHRRPVRRGQGARRRLLDRSRRPTSTPRWSGAARRRARAACRSRCARSRTSPQKRAEIGPCRCSPLRRSSVSSARSTAARWPSWSVSSVTSTSPRRRSRTRSPRPCGAGPTTGLPPSPAGWIITTARNRAIDRLRRESSRADRHAQAALLHAQRRAGRRRGGTRARRPAAPDLHLLPSRARHRRAGRAHAAAARRPDDAGDRARLPACPSRRWPSASCARRARSATRRSPTASPPMPICRRGCGPCWRSST